MEDVVHRLQSLSQSEADLSNHVWVFDTLKKMTDVIQKKSLRDLLQTMRKLSSRGMTIVMLCHTNKHKDGNLIFEGTGDLKSDVDELIYLDKVKQPDGSLVVTTRPDKVRADIQPLTFEITANRTVTQKDAVVDVKNLQALSDQIERDAQLIHHIEAAIAEGPAIQKDIFERCKIE